MAQIVIHISEEFQSQIRRRLQTLGQAQQRYMAGLIARELVECGQITEEDAARFSELSTEEENLVAKLPMELYRSVTEILAPGQTLQNYFLGLIEADLPRIEAGEPLEIRKEDRRPHGEIKLAKVYYPTRISATLRNYWNGEGPSRSAHLITLIRRDLALRQEQSADQGMDMALQ